MKKSRTKFASLRNGLKWREGRPRWEPSPASRAIGVHGADLRRPDGAWMDRGEAVGAADARQLWARMLREAAAGGAAGAAALDDLRDVLDRLGPPADSAAQARRDLLEDLLEHARRLLGEASANGPRAPARRDRTGERLVELYFADTSLDITASTRKVYGIQKRRFVARWGAARVAEINRGALIEWYRELRLTLSVSNANQCLGAAQAFLTYATRLNPPWINTSPATKLGLEAAPGRLVFWSVAEERDFVAWCDGHGWADVADGIVAGLWMGARIGDICRANLSDLAGEVWDFEPAKTKRKRQRAMPAIMQPVKDRLARRRAQLVTAIDGAFLFDPRVGRRYTAAEFGGRFAEAKALFCATSGAPDGFARLHVQDTRDTCITRLWEAEVPPARMWAWTGHSQKSVERILRTHYLVLREEGALAMADQLATWARKQGVALP